MEHIVAQLRYIYQDTYTLLHHQQYAPAYGNSLLKGPWGALLFMFYYEQYVDPAQDHAAGLLEKLYADYTLQNGGNYGFCSGHTGPFWLLQHLHRHGFVELDMEALAAGFICTLIPHSNEQIAARDFDFLHGSTGICNFLLGFSDKTDVAGHLEHFVYALAAASKKTDKGRSFPFLQVYNAPKGVCVDAFSLAHGTCAILIVLAGIYKAGIATQACEQLIGEGLAFILQHKNEIAGNLQYSLYPPLLDGKGTNSRLSWCYGDLNVAIALWHCGKALQQPAWMAEALAIMHYNTGRSTNDAAGIEDSCLCHGAAGIAAFYRRFWFETKEAAFYDCALHWHNRAAGMLSFSETASRHGMKVWRGDDRQWDYLWDLLDGSCGLGLSMISQLHAAPLAWDECLLLS